MLGSFVIVDGLGEEEMVAERKETRGAGSEDQHISSRILNAIKSLLKRSYKNVVNDYLLAKDSIRQRKGDYHPLSCQEHVDGEGGEIGPAPVQCYRLTTLRAFKFILPVFQGELALLHIIGMSLFISQQGCRTCGSPDVV